MIQFASWFLSLLVGWAVQIDLCSNTETTENKDGNLVSAIIACLTWSIKQPQNLHHFKLKNSIHPMP